jgi:hypothetical protein
MGSLTVCIKKAGAALHADDKAAIIERSRQLRAEGVGVAEAAMRAVDERITAVQSLAEDRPATMDDAAKVLDGLKDVLGDLGNLLSGPAVSPNTVFTDDEAAKRRERLRKNQGRLSSGIDPQDMLDGIWLAGYHIERGARTFSAYARAMIADLGDWVKPHLKGWYMAVKYGPHAAEFEDMSPVADVEAADLNNLEAPDAQHSDVNLESDRPDGDTSDVAGADGDGASAPGRGNVGSGTRAARGQGERAGDPGIPGTGTDAAGASSDPAMGQDPSAVPGGVAGDLDDERSPIDSDSGPPTESLTDEGVEEAARQRSRNDIQRLKAQNDAEKLKVDPTDPDSIRASLPVLLDQQQDDVIFALDRFRKESGYGVLFTNGTGTGKTFSGLGIAKIFAKQGKTNILIVAPNQEVINGWKHAGPMVGLDVTQLKDTKDAGNGVVVTTYANLKDNNALVQRNWDLVLSDEAQNLSANADGTATDALLMTRAVTMHPRGAQRRTQAFHPDLYAEIQELEKQAAAAQKAKNRSAIAMISARLEPLYRQWTAHLRKVQGDIEAAQGVNRTRLVMLSATPFAYHVSVKASDGYLFDFRDGYVESAAYNAGGAYEQFMVRHFGYRMRTGKLNKPDERFVDVGLMERAFNGWLRREGAASGRMLDVDADYDRRFVAANSAIGSRIDQGFQWFWDKPAEELIPDMPVDEKNGPTSAAAVKTAMHSVSRKLRGRFNYETRMRLLEALKAEAAVPYIRAHMAAGRKVVVFHDRIQGQLLDPFNLSFTDDQPVEAAVWEQWRKEFADLAGFDFRSLKNPIETMVRAFGTDAMTLNGPTGKKRNAQHLALLNSDERGPMVLVVQSDKEAGWSGHDTTGKHPRVLINLGLPVRPTRSIQQEGRIYRVGQISNAMFRYFNTQTAWEREAFANTMARRASTAENMAMGEQARGLLDAYIEAFEDTDAWEPGFEGEGTGGKQRDRDMAAVISEFDRAKTLYYAQRKKDQRDKHQEGSDYFATPEPLGLKMVQWGDLRIGESALEPSAGHGAIARWFPDNVSRLAIERSPSLSSKLALAYDGTIRQENFESLHAVNKADVIVMNPPFGRNSGGKLAIEHLDKAYNDHLNVGGRLVLLFPEGKGIERFEEWLNGTHEVTRPARAAFQSPHGQVYKGDTLTWNVFGHEGQEQSGVFVTRHADGRVTARKGEIETTFWESQIVGVKPGPREPSRTMEPNAEGADLVATIRLPGSTFNRAATGVRTRIVVIDKLAKGQESAGKMSVDLSELKDNTELFDAIENLGVPERTKPRPADIDPDAPVADAKPKAEAKKPQKSGAEAAAEAGEELAKEKGWEIVDYTTQAGNPLRLYVATHLTYQQAKEIDDRTWQVKGKPGHYYIRTKHLAMLDARYPPPANLQNIARPQTETPEFKRWFGKSKVVDDAGKPLVVYHGSYRDFEAFNPKASLGWRGPSMDTIGSWFSTTASDEVGAGMYAGGEGAIHYPVYLSITKPRVYATFNAFLNDMHRSAGRDPKKQNPIGRGTTDELKAKLKAQGYDGILFERTDNQALYDQISKLDAEIRSERDPEYRQELQDERKGLVKELEKWGSSTEFDGQDVWIAFEPEQIKSAIGNSGAFDPANPNIAQNLSRAAGAIGRMGYERQDVPRIQAARRLAVLVGELDQGLITEAEFAAAVRSLAGAMDRVVTTKAANKLMADRQRGPEIVREKLMRARRQGTLGQDLVDFALWTLDKNWHLAANLGISITKPREGVAGDYNPQAEIIRIFKGTSDTETGVHEVMHHAERMMPPEMQAAIRREWAKALAAAIKAATPNQVQELTKIMAALAGDQRAHQDVVRAIQDGVLNYDAHYQLMNPSEFWAVNAARLMSNRYAAEGSIWAKIKTYLAEMVQKLKGLLGLNSDAPILRAMDYVLNPDNFGPERGGRFESDRMLVDRAVEELPQNIEEEPNFDDENLQNINRPAAPPTLKPSTGVIDVASRLAFGQLSRVTSPAYNGIINLADRSLSVFGDAYEYAKAGMVDRYGLSEGHYEAKTAMKTAIRVNARKTKEVIDKLKALDFAQSRIAYLWMGDQSEDSATERALMDQLPEEPRLVLASLKRDIEALGREAVELKLITPEVFERNKMAYLHRSYDRYELESPLAKTTRAQSVALMGDAFKQRGMRFDVTMAQVGTEEWWERKTNKNAHDPALKGKKFFRLERRGMPDVNTPQLFDDENGQPLGPLREVMYWPMDEAIPEKYNDWRNEGVWEARWFDKRDKVGMFRDFTLKERTKMGEIQEVKYAVATTMLQVVRDVETARFLDWVARNESVIDQSLIPEGGKLLPTASDKLTRSYLKNEWVQVPDVEIAGTGVKRFGALGGRYIPGPVWNDIRQISSLTDRGDLSEVYASMMRAWKISKALALDTPIPTPTGWTTMGEINVGDQVFDERGEVCEVLGATPVQLDRKCYEVEFSDGTKIVADAEHLWFTNRRGSPGVRTTEEIRATLKERTRGDAIHSIPVAGALKLDAAALPVAPYVLGAWLGDGDSAAARITQGAADAPEIIAHLEAAGVRCSTPGKDKRSTAMTFQVRRGEDGCIRGHGVARMTPKGCAECAYLSRRLKMRGELLPPGQHPSIQERLRFMGLLGNKHVPAEYLRASEAQRRELLQGLMDTDGWITEKGICQFGTSIPELRDGVMELLRSLGYKPTTMEHQPNFRGKPGKLAWKIHFKAYADAPVFKLSRKRERLAAPPARKQRSQSRQVVAVTPVKSVPVRCIAVSSKSRLYLAGAGMVPTHNTALSPVTHMNNVMSNFMLADAHDIQARHIYQALKAWTQHKTDPEAKKLVEDYQDNGGDAGMFNENEVRRELFEPLLEELRGEIERDAGGQLVTAAAILDLFQHRQFRQAFAALGQNRRVGAGVGSAVGAAVGGLVAGPVGAVQGAVAGAALPWLAPKLMRLYGLEDEVFRLAAFVKARQDGLSDHDAGQFARNSFLNYEITAPWINAMRRTAWPFLAFTYRAVPMLLKVGADKPHKFAKYALLSGALSALAYAMLGDDGDEEAERAYMADEKAGKIWGFLTPKLVRMPWNDRNNAPVFLDIRRWIPGGDIVDLGQSQSALPIPPPLMPGGPMVLFFEFVLNTSGFTGRDITLKSDELADRFSKSGDFLWKGVAPNFPGLPGTWSTQALVDASNGKVNPGPFGSEASSMTQAALGAVGIKIRSYPMDSLQFNETAKARMLTAEILREQKKAIKAAERSYPNDPERAKEEQQKIQLRALEKIQKIHKGLEEKKKVSLGQD